MTAYSRIEDVPLYRYGLIMCDPPWRFDHWGEPNERSADGHYSTMDVEALKSLPVEPLAAPDCWLWLWATGAMLPQAIDVLRAWRFTYVTAGWWTKTQKKDPGKVRIGLGHTLRDAGEPFLIGRIGSPKVFDHGIPSTILAPRREHSRKPEIAYSHAERLAHPDAWRLDLFSRQERYGWDCLGDECDKFEPVARDL